MQENQRPSQETTRTIKDAALIFVTGGTGLLGNCIVRELCERGQRVRVLCREGTPQTALEDLDVEIVRGDLNRPDILMTAVSGCEAVIHSAALIHIGWHRLDPSRQVNVDGTQAIVAACLKHSATMLHISTVDTLPAAIEKSQPIDEAGQGGMPKTRCAYVVSKVEAEQVVRRAIDQQGLEAMIIHPGFMLGPYDWKPSSGRMFLEVCKAPMVAAPVGGCSLCDARQVANAIVNSLHFGRHGQSYILAGENLSYRELWTRMLHVAGRKRRVFKMGPSVRVFGHLIDVATRYLPIPEGDINGAAIAMGSLNHFYNSEKAIRELGYEMGDTQQTLHDAWKWLTRE